MSWEGELHPNSRIATLEVETGDDAVESVAPERIETDELAFAPIFAADFSSVRELLLSTSEAVFEHYSEDCRRLPDEVRKFVDTRQRQWKAGERFEYVIRHESQLIGKTYLESNGSGGSYTTGLWLQKPFWGQGISQRRADALLHVAFRELGATVVTIGTVIQNTRSRRAIEKYIGRYGGSYIGTVPVPDARYHEPDDPTAVVQHPEWAVTRAEFETTEQGIGTTIGGVSYEQITFD